MRTVESETEGAHVLQSCTRDVLSQTSIHTRAPHLGQECKSVRSIYYRVAGLLETIKRLCCLHTPPVGRTVSLTLCYHCAINLKNNWLILKMPTAHCMFHFFMYNIVLFNIFCCPFDLDFFNSTEFIRIGVMV